MGLDEAWVEHAEFYLVKDPGDQVWTGAAVLYDKDGGFSFQAYRGEQWVQDNTLETIFVGGEGSWRKTSQEHAEHAEAAPAHA